MQHTTAEQDDPTTEPDICPGPCNRAWEAAERRQHETGEPHNLQPAHGQPLWCHECRDTIENMLRDLYREAANVPRSGRLNTPKSDTGIKLGPDIHASPSPAHDFHDELDRWVTTYARATANQLGQTPKTHSLGYLITNLSYILSRDPAGIAFGMAVYNWHRRIINAAGGPPLVHRIPGTCPHCNRSAGLRRKDGEDLVKCRFCQAVWDVDHWRQLVRAVLAS